MVRAPVMVLFHSMVVRMFFATHAINPLRVPDGMLMTPLVFLPPLVLFMLGLVGWPFCVLFHCMMMAFLTFSNREWRSHRVLIGMMIVPSFHM